MLKTCFAASILAVFALAVPVQAQSDTPYQLAQDDMACTAQGVGSETDGYSDCMAQRKIDRFQQVQRRAADLAAMPKVLNPMPPDHTYLLPENTRALQGTPDMPKQTITTKQVCVTEVDAGNPVSICQKEVEVKMKAAPRSESRDDPGSALADSNHSIGDFMSVHPQYGGQ